jgi:Arc/MetJ-type ribon-helix-helix transcriptional regulator
MLLIGAQNGRNVVNMTEEVPFRSMKITLSEEALNMLESLRMTGSFRSSSMTIEECVRTIYDITRDITALTNIHRKNQKSFSNEVMLEAFRRYMLRLGRFYLAQAFSEPVGDKSAGT